MQILRDKLVANFLTNATAMEIIYAETKEIWDVGATAKVPAQPQKKKVGGGKQDETTMS